MSRKKMRSKADEFEMDEAGYDEEYGDAPAEQHIYDEASGAEPELRAPKVKKKKRKKGGSTALWLILVLLLAIIGGGVFAGYEITQSSANLPNVYVGSIAVGKRADLLLLDSGLQVQGVIRDGKQVIDNRLN